MDKAKHVIMLRAIGNSLEMRCSCGQFLMDKPGIDDKPAEASLPEITMHVTAHYLAASHPEKLNGHREKPPVKLIEGHK